MLTSTQTVKPILFNTHMVCNILDGCKTETRRVVKPQPLSKLAYCCMGFKCGTWAYPDKNAWKHWDDESFRLPDGLTDKDRNRHWTPPCHTGDILYVREKWCSAYDGEKYFYFADKCTPREERKLLDYDNIRWHPSIYMPREAARLFLRVTDVWVERLQDITEEQAIAEGAKDPYDYQKSEWYDRFPYLLDKYQIAAFAGLWDSTIPKHPNKFKRYPYYWDDNPWVWVIEFERISKEEAEQC